MIDVVINGTDRIHAETVTDMVGAIQGIRADQQGEIERLRGRLVAQVEENKSIRADLDEQRTLAAYGPQLFAEKTDALNARDAALEENARLIEQLRRTQTAQQDGDRTRRAQAAEIRTLKEKLEDATRREADDVLSVRRARKTARRR
jgi:hypothetical protein